jgi:hypothetical protein
MNATSRLKSHSNCQACKGSGSSSSSSKQQVSVRQHSEPCQWTCHNKQTHAQSKAVHVFCQCTSMACIKATSVMTQTDLPQQYPSGMHPDVRFIASIALQRSLAQTHAWTMTVVAFKQSHLRATCMMTYIEAR